MIARNPYLSRQEKAQTQSVAYRKSRGNEKKLAARYGGLTTPMSGAGRQKGDVRKRGVARIELKTTSNKSFSVTKEMLDKIEAAARCCDEVPVLIVEFLTASGAVDRRVAVVAESDLHGMLS